VTFHLYPLFLYQFSDGLSVVSPPTHPDLVGARLLAIDGTTRCRDCVSRALSGYVFGVMRRVRFAPSPTGSLHVGNALSAVANRTLGDWVLLRIDDTDPKRNVAHGEEAIIEDLLWLGVEWNEGPVRQSERQARYREAAEPLGSRFNGTTLIRDDGTATYQLASVVDDVDFGITHVVRGNDHRPNEPLHRRLFEALGHPAPEFVHHGLILGEDGRKLAKRAPGATIASLRESGIPAEAVRRYLEELGVPKHDVRYDLSRIRRLAVDVIGELSDEELARRVGVPAHVVPVMRGARDFAEAKAYAEAVLDPPDPVKTQSVETLARFKELRERAANGLGPNAAKSVVRELKAVGGDLKALRLALTGRERGPELWAVVAALPKDEALRRVDAAV
jgi:glutamyl/glutaminyl-tRNA synthetase